MYYGLCENGEFSTKTTELVQKKSEPRSPVVARTSSKIGQCELVMKN